MASGSSSSAAVIIPWKFVVSLPVSWSATQSSDD